LKVRGALRGEQLLNTGACDRLEDVPLESRHARELATAILMSGNLRSMNAIVARNSTASATAALPRRVSWVSPRPVARNNIASNSADSASSSTIKKRWHVGGYTRRSIGGRGCCASNFADIELRCALLRRHGPGRRNQAVDFPYYDDRRAQALIDDHASLPVLWWALCSRRARAPGDWHSSAHRRESAAARFSPQLFQPVQESLPARFARIVAHRHSS
jgi:hypothetical protein